jgi:hypothetical protein
MRRTVAWRKAASFSTSFALSVALSAAPWAVPSVAILAAGSALAAGTRTCGEGLPSNRTLIEAPGYTLAFVTVPTPIEVGTHFVVDFAVCPLGNARKPHAVRVDATMPEHRHGMNYRPSVVLMPTGIYRAEGMLFHMPGRWDLAFDLVDGERTQRLVKTLRVE